MVAAEVAIRASDEGRVHALVIADVDAVVVDSS